MLGAEIRLRRADTGKIGIVPGLAYRFRHRKIESYADRVLHLMRVVLALTDEHDTSRSVEKIKGGPRRILECAPGGIGVVQANGKSRTLLPDVGLDIRAVMLEAKLRRVNADDAQTLRAIFVVPPLQVHHGSAAVDARIGPEVHQHHAALQRSKRNRFAVDPSANADEVGPGLA